MKNGKSWRRDKLFLLTVFFLVFVEEVCGASPVPNNLDTTKDSVRISVHFWTSISGTIHGKLQKQDSVNLYAGELPTSSDPAKYKIRKWGLYLFKDDEVATFCYLQRVYDYGRKAMFTCPISGSYIALVQDDEVEKKAMDEGTPPSSSGTADNFNRVWESRASLKLFDLIRALQQNDAHDFKKTYRKIWLEPNTENPVVISDPFEVEQSDFCFTWNYRIKELTKVGYITRESEPSTGLGQGTSYVVMELKIWVVEVGSVTRSERNARREQLIVVSEYSKILTTKFKAKGLEPCLKKVHPSVEITSEVTFIKEDDADENFKTPHWEMIIKIHTNRVVTNLKDVEFLISSRQQIALFHCFVGSIRVFVNVRNYDFVSRGQFERTAINWDASVISKPSLEFLKLKVKHLYGHRTVFAGGASSREYQPGNVRTDMFVVDNPCVAQEIAIAAAGRIYIGENLLLDPIRNKLEIVLPGLGDIDTESGVPEDEMQRRHQAFFEIADVAFTPTHVVFLMKDSSVFLHSHSAYYKGLAYLTSTRKNRLSSLVKRRWCARTGTPKTSNMIIPAYSSVGDIIIIQIYPVESINVWSRDPADLCLGKDPDFFTKTQAQVHHDINETCIHQNELVDRSDEKGLSQQPDSSNCPKKASTISEDDIEEVVSDKSEKFSLWNNDEILPEFDPHFPQVLTNAALYKIDTNVSLFNRAITFHLDYEEGGKRRLQKLLIRNGFSLIGDNNLHSLEFTAIEKKFIVGVEFQSKEFLPETAGGPKYDFTMMITTMLAAQMPSKIYPLDETQNLEATFGFSSVILTRKTPYMLKTFDATGNGSAPYTTRLFPINTAIPSYVIDLGNVFVFSSVESKYARPLTFFKREDIHKTLKDPSNPIMLEDSIRLPVFSTGALSCTSRQSCTPSDELFDIVVTEQGMVSVLKRRSVIEVYEGQSVYIGSVMTSSSLREVRPFAAQDKVFQFASPEGQIIYGEFKTRGYPLYEACDSKQDPAIPPNKTCLIPHDTPDLDPYCVILIEGATQCIPWEFVNDTKSGDPDPDPLKADNEIGFCDQTKTIACILKALNDPGFPPENAPRMEVESAEILGVPFYSILYGNLEVVSEEKVTLVGSVDSGSPTENRLCPFAHFKVAYEKFDYAEIGFHIRMTAVISYLGKNIPSEADLIIEYDNIPGIQTTISASIVEEKDQTTLTKSIDITLRLSDINLMTMQRKKMTSQFLEKRNLAKEKTDVFSITFRPSVVSLRCQHEDFFTTIHYTIGCNPFSQLRFLAEASPVVRRKVFQNATQGGKKEWFRERDSLIVPRRDVWHKQREAFKCANKDAKTCKIPYAYLYGDNIYDLSWRDPFVPQFEQIMQPYSRRVSGNVIIYDLLGFSVVMNISSLKAGCYHTAESWYNTLLTSTKNIAKGIATEQEDLYHYFIDCFDQSILPRDKPLVLESAGAEYRLLNLTNHNRIRFDIQKKGPGRTKNRNQILIFRAVVINTGFNRYTYCKLMDTFFLIRVVGLPTPRKGLEYYKYAAVVIGMLIILSIAYILFSLCLSWKLDLATIPKAVAKNPDELNEEQDKEDDGQKAARELQEKQRIQAQATKLKMFAKFRERKMQRDQRQDENKT